MILLQLSAAQGPDECALAVAKALPCLLGEAERLDTVVRIVEEVSGPRPGTLLSVLLALDGNSAETLADAWSGTLLWICPSPYRPRHGRKNWYFGGARFDVPPPGMESQIRFEALRSSGPGGQHVNTTDSAVRATHLASGFSVKVQSERSQHANKRLALLLIGRYLAEQAELADSQLRAQRRLFHHHIERGNPSRTFHGERFDG